MATIEAAQRPLPPAEHHRPSAGFMEWITTVDHKKIGILYLFASFSFFIIGGLLALTVRTQLVVPNNSFLSENAYNQAFTMHGTIMIYLFSVPIFTGLGNYLVPLQIGTADVAFPRVNALSFWLFLFGALMVVSGIFTNDGAAQATWIAITPLSLAAKTPGAGQSLWVVGIFLTGIGSVLGAINLLTTIFAMRAPGMTMFRTPIFTWSIVVQQMLVLLAFPVLAAGLSMQFIERRYHGLFFNGARGGSPVLWLNIFWFFGHPEVYIVALPAFGIISEILPVFSRKPLFGYRAMVFSLFAISALSFSVWAHHMFTTGAVNLAWFSAMSFLIGVPTGIKFFNWIGTMWRGHLRMNVPMLFAQGFLVTFLIGGITGIFLASPPIDFSVHGTYYVIAHFHYTMLSCLEFALFGGFTYWIPKMSGYMLSERLGKITFWLIAVGFNLTFFPMFLLGLKGMPRRVAVYAPHLGWTGLNQLATAGAYLIALSVLTFIINFIYNIVLKHGAVAGDDPWEGNTLEWATTSPPPHHNFSSMPAIFSERPLFDARHGLEAPGTGFYTDPQTSGATPESQHGQDQ